MNSNSVHELKKGGKKMERERMNTYAGAKKRNRAVAFPVKAEIV